MAPVIAAITRAATIRQEGQRTGAAPAGRTGDHPADYSTGNSGKDRAEQGSDERGTVEQ